MVSVSLVFFEENIFLVNQIIQHLYIIILYWKQKQKNKKQKTKIASITLKPITVLDTTPYHNFGLVYFCSLRG